VDPDVHVAVAEKVTGCPDCEGEGGESALKTTLGQVPAPTIWLSTGV
jgi:hypothetical protein